MNELKPISKELLETLLNMHESEILDFKQEQYPFESADNSQKSEIIKDIVAFANAWKTSDAYILTGVKEVPEARANVLGVSGHIDDAKLQQLVNTKTNNPVRFSYIATEIDGKSIGVYCIAQIQDRPIYLKKDFGKLEKEKVYIRHGSATDTAGPDEVARMGKDQGLSIRNNPVLDLGFGRPHSREILGPYIVVNPISFTEPPMATTPSEHDMPKQTGTLPFENMLNVIRRQSMVGASIYEQFISKPSHEEIFAYRKRISLIVPLRLVLRNLGESVANDARVELSCDKSNCYKFIRERDIPIDPYKSRLGPQYRVSSPEFNLYLSELSDNWHIEAHFGKVQPKADGWLNETLYLECVADTTVLLNGKIYDDNLSKPIEIELTIEISIEEMVYDGANWNEEEGE